jgi:hypothetical protein
MEKEVYFIVFLLIVSLLVGGILFYFLKTKPSKPKVSPSPTISASPTPSLEVGSFFEIEQQKLPKFLELGFYPFELGTGEKQKIVVIFDEEGGQINKVLAKVEDEIEKKEIDFSLVKREEKKSFWQAEWTPKLIKSREYAILLSATDEKGRENGITVFWQGKESQNQPSFFDSLKYLFKRAKEKFLPSFVFAEWINEKECTKKEHFPHAGDCTLSQSLSLSGITGVDGGSLVIAEGVTLQLNPNTTFVINPEKEISSMGTIVKSKDNAQIIKDYLWMKDGDNDKCAVFSIKSNDNTESDVRYGSSPPGLDWKRVKNLQYYPDLDDEKAGNPPKCGSTLPQVTEEPGSSNQPDLVIEDVWFTSEGKVGYRIKNKGKVPISGKTFYVDLYLKDSSEILDWDELDKLEAGASKNRTIPKWTCEPRKEYTIRLVADSVDNIKESSEENNEKIKTIICAQGEYFTPKPTETYSPSEDGRTPVSTQKPTSKPTATPTKTPTPTSTPTPTISFDKPDLIIEDIWFTLDGRVGYRIKNQGTASVQNTVFYNVLLVDTSTYAPDWDTMDNILAGSSVERIMPNWRCTQGQSYFINILVDFYNSVSESNEQDNNFYAKTLYCLGGTPNFPTPTPTPPIIPPPTY